MSISMGDRVRVLAGDGVPPHFVGQFGRVARTLEDGGLFTHHVVLDAEAGGPRSAWFRPSELTLVAEVLLEEESEPVDEDTERELVTVLESDPDYVIDLSQFGDGDHSPLRLTQAEADRLVSALLAKGL